MNYLHLSLFLHPFDMYIMLVYLILCQLESSTPWPLLLKRKSFLPQNRSNCLKKDCSILQARMDLICNLQVYIHSFICYIMMYSLWSYCLTIVEFAAYMDQSDVFSDFRDEFLFPPVCFSLLFVVCFMLNIFNIVSSRHD